MFAPPQQTAQSAVDSVKNRPQVIKGQGLVDAFATVRLQPFPPRKFTVSV